MANIPFLNNAYFAAKVGIGTESPGVKLDVAGSSAGDAVSIRAYNSVANFGNSLLIAQSDNANTFIHAGVKIQSSGSPFYIYQSGGSAANVLRFNYNSLADTGGQMVLTSTGNVGIGTTSPDYNLQVEKSGNAEIQAQRISGAGVLIQAQSAVGVVGTNTNHRLDLKTNGATRVTVNTSGNVGIGTTSPGTKLFVVGNASVSAGKAFRMYNAANNGWGEMSFIEADNRIQFNRGIQNSGVDWRFPDSGNSYVNANEGNFGIGVADPDAKLEIVDGSDKFRYSSNLTNGFDGIELIGGAPAIKFNQTASGVDFYQTALGDGTLRVFKEGGGTSYFNYS